MTCDTTEMVSKQVHSGSNPGQVISFTVSVFSVPQSKDSITLKVNFPGRKRRGRKLPAIDRHQ
jgi:hypothetical protein